MTKPRLGIRSLTALAALAVANDGSVSDGGSAPTRRRRTRAFDPSPPDGGDRVTLARVIASPKAERREMSDEEREQLRADRKERRADRMRLRKRRGWR